MLFPWQKAVLFCLLFLSLSAQGSNVPLLHQPINYGANYNAAYIQFSQQNPWLTQLDLVEKHNSDNFQLAHISADKLIYRFDKGYFSAHTGEQSQLSSGFSSHQFYLHGGLTIYQYNNFNLLIDAQHLQQENKYVLALNSQDDVLSRSHNKFTQLSLLGQYYINPKWQLIGGFSTNSYSHATGHQLDLNQSSNKDTKAILSTKYSF